MAKFTPGPWEVHGDDGLLIGANDGKMMIAEAKYNHVVAEWSRKKETAQANAAHIVRCVNAHEKLVEALRKVNTWLIAPDPHAFEEMYQLTLEALALAEK